MVNADIEAILDQFKQEGQKEYINTLVQKIKNSAEFQNISDNQVLFSVELRSPENTYFKMSITPKNNYLLPLYEEMLDLAIKRNTPDDEKEDFTIDEPDSSVEDMIDGMSKRYKLNI